MKIKLPERLHAVFARRNASSENKGQTQWQVKDFIDLEYFLKKDPLENPKSASSPSVSQERERYLAYAKTHTPPFSRRELIHYWLNGKREEAKKASKDTFRPPGDLFTETFHLCLIFVICFALVSGASLAWSVLSYQGREPINIFTCLWVLLVPQILLLMLLIILMTLRRLRLVTHLQGVYPILTSLTRRMMSRLKTTAERSLSASQESRIHAVYDVIGRQNALYGSIFLWPVFILAQTLMVCFNIGLIASTFLKLSITDLAFGWQSTFTIAPATVHGLVRTLSVPWSWLTSALPTIEQIEGSKIVLKEGMAHLATDNLVSWWPFLMLTLLFYGLLPRLILLYYGIRQQSRAIERIDFISSDCDRLIQRMQAPVVATEGRRYVSLQTPAPVAPLEESLPTGELNTRDAMGKAVALVPEDMDNRCSDYDLEERISDVLGLEVTVRMPCVMVPETDMKALAGLLPDEKEPDSSLRFIVIQEAWQPPIRETLAWLRALRQHSGKTVGIIVGLVGKPAQGMTFTSPDDTDLVIWEQAVNQLADPYMRVENLGG